MTKKERADQIFNEVSDNYDFEVYHGALGNALYGADKYSECIKRLSEDSEYGDDFIQLTSDLAKRFYSGDLGTMYTKDEERYKDEDIATFTEAGLYETEYGKIYIKRDVYYTTICLFAER